MKETCKLCFADSFVESENDIVCERCGAVYGQVIHTDAIIPKYSVPLTSEEKIGSCNIVDDSLKLSHLNKKFTKSLLSNDDVYMEYFSQACDDLHIPKSIARNAFFMFKKLRHSKLGLGRTAVFCIVNSYTSADVLYDGDAVINAIRNRFRLRRKISISNAIYKVKPIAVEMKLTANYADSTSLVLKKNIHRDNHHKATQIIDSFGGNISDKAKSTQEFLDAYGGTPIMCKEAKKQ